MGPNDDNPKPYVLNIGPRADDEPPIMTLSAIDENSAISIAGTFVELELNGSHGFSLFFSNPLGVANVVRPRDFGDIHFHIVGEEENEIQIDDIESNYLFTLLMTSKYEPQTN